MPAFLSLIYSDVLGKQSMSLMHYRQCRQILFLGNPHCISNLLPHHLLQVNWSILGTQYIAVDQREPYTCPQGMSHKIQLQQLYLLSDLDKPRYKDNLPLRLMQTVIPNCLDNFGTQMSLDKL